MAMLFLLYLFLRNLVPFAVVNIVGTVNNFDGPRRRNHKNDIERKEDLKKSGSRFLHIHVRLTGVAKARKRNERRGAGARRAAL